MSSFLFFFLSFLHVLLILICSLHIYAFLSFLLPFFFTRTSNSYSISTNSMPIVRQQYANSRHEYPYVISNSATSPYMADTRPNTDKTRSVCDRTETRQFTARKRCNLRGLTTGGRAETHVSCHCSWWLVTIRYTKL
jgi:hypothetical protein